MAKLVYTDQSGREMTVPLGPDSPVVTVGRATDCTIRSNRKSVSRNHAEFHYKNGRYEVVDLNSSNGTYLIVDDRRQPVIEPQPLNHYDEVWCGDFILRFLEEESDFAPVANDPGFGQDVGFGAEQGLGGEVSAGVSGNFGQQPASGRHSSISEPQMGREGEFDSGGLIQQNNHPSAGPGVSQGMGTGTPPPQSGGVSQGLGDTPPPVSGGSGRGPGQPPENIPYNDSGISADSGAVSAGTGGANEAELQRLRDEKQSIQDLCDRQARDLDDLRQRYEEARQELDDLRSELEQAQQDSGDPQEMERLRHDLEAANADSGRLREELALARQDSLDLDDAQQRAEQAEQRLSDATEKIDDLRQRLDSSEQESRARIDDLQDELARTRDKLDKARQSSAREEVSELREEVARLERLLGEFEKRNRDLQLEVDEKRQTDEALRQELDKVKEDLKSAAASRDELAEEASALRKERDELVAANEENSAARQTLEEEARALRSEIEGLKQRLRLEKERARANSSSEEVEAMQAQIDELNEQLAAATSAATSGGGDTQAANGLPLDDLADHARTLDRVVDAIERTDLSALSTVDRVRLQSAIRETQPRQTLSAMLELVGEN